MIAMYYYRARYYDPEIGRFVSEDPLGFAAGDVNFYAYVGNNPINFNDPSGKIVPQLIGGTINALAGAGVSFFSNEPITLSSVGIDFATGAAGVGLISRFKQLSTLARVGATSASNSGLFVANQSAKNTANILDTGKSFSFENLTTGITAGNIVANGLLGVPFSNVGGKIAGNAPAITANAFEQAAVEVGFQAPIDVGRGLLINQTGPTIDNQLSSFGLPSSASGGFVLYPNKPNTNMLQSVYAK